MTIQSTTALEPQKRTERFIAFLQSKLDAESFDRLHFLLGYKTTNRLSRLLNPEADKLGSFTAQEVGKLGQALNIPPRELIREWGLGEKVITLAEAKTLLGIEVGITQAA